MKIEGIRFSFIYFLFILKLHKLDFNWSSKFEKAFQLSYVAIAVVYFGLMLLTFFLVDQIKLKKTVAKFEFIVSYAVSNTFTSLFFLSFCILIFAIYRRFEILNECIV